MMRIEYSSWGLANRFGDVVVLNQHLLKYPWLHKVLLDHELSHVRNPLKNIKIDIDSVKINHILLKLKFMLKHPKTFVQMSPIYFYRGRPYFDLSLILIYLMIFGMFLLRWGFL